MKYCIADARCPMVCLSSGNLVNEDRFIHPRRILDSFVFILVQEGTLHITQGDTSFDVYPNEFAVLFPGILHYGTRPTEGRLSYYWTHFSITDPQHRICSESSLRTREELLPKNPVAFDVPASEYFLLPEYGRLSGEKRSTLLFVQLLDISRRENFRSSWRSNYALSTLLMEVSHEAHMVSRLSEEAVPVRVLEAAEWIRTHYEQPFSISELAEHFGYHPTYLSALFKKYTGYPVLSYINRTRINASKNLLGASMLPIAQVAESCGFTDEKHFMKLFKRLEGLTPTQYRKAFYQKMVNIH